MRRRIALDGITDDAIPLLPALASHPEVELVRVFARDAASLRRRLALLEPRAAALLQRLLTDDRAALAGLELVSPEDAAALCGRTSESGDARSELLQALAEVGDALDLAGGGDALYARLLDAAIAATGATGGSLLAVDREGAALRVRAAVGLEPALWPGVRVALGSGLAGRAWAEGRAFVARGPADASHFELARERHDVASALLVPFARGEAHGVLCLHHHTDPALFSERDLDFAAALGAAIGRIAAHAERAAALVQQARRAEVQDEVDGALVEREPLAALCRIAAAHGGQGAATLWWRGEATGAFRLAASSLPGGALGAAAELAPGEGIDGRVARDREPILLRREDGRLAHASLPLLAGETLLGVLSVQCGAGDASEDALRVLAGCAAAALDRRARDERERARAARRAAVAEAGLRILAADGADRVAEELAAAAALVLDAEHVFVRVLDAERRQMRLRVPREPRGVDEALAALDRRAAREALRRRSAVEASEDDAAEALLVLPILLGGRALGTLGLYDRRAPAPPRFDATERVLAEQLAAFAGRALAAGQPAVAAPVPRDLAQRIDEELARAAESQASPAFALVLCRIENAAELGAVAAALALQRTTAALAQQLRAFDALAPLGPDGAAALLPAPGPAPAERIARLARAVAEAIAKEDDARVALAFGWALHPGDGDRASALLERAAETRIRML